MTKSKNLVLLKELHSFIRILYNRLEREYKHSSHLVYNVEEFSNLLKRNGRPIPEIRRIIMIWVQQERDGLINIKLTGTKEEFNNIIGVKNTELYKQYLVIIN